MMQGTKIYLLFGLGEQGFRRPNIFFFVISESHRGLITIVFIDPGILVN